MSKRDLSPEELEAIRWEKWHARQQAKRLADIQRRLCAPMPKTTCYMQEGKRRDLSNHGQFVQPGI